MVVETREKRVSTTRHIYFTPDTMNRLDTYLRKYYGNHRALSLVVQRAVEEFLKHEQSKEDNSENRK